MLLLSAAALSVPVSHQPVLTPVVRATSTFDDFCNTGGNGCWPSSFLLGTEKAGTAALAIALYQSGHVALGKAGRAGDTMPCEETLDDSAVKAPHAFDQYFAANGSAPNAALYTNLFGGKPSAMTRAKASTSLAVATVPSYLDATPTYFSSPEAPDMLTHMMPKNLLAKAKFVVVLREPVARALNLFNHMRASSDSAKDPEHVHSDCFKRQQQLAGVRDGNVTFDSVVQCALAASDLFIKWGSYVEGLKAWTSKVSRKQLLIVAHETLQNEPEKAMGMVVKHYGLDASQKKSLPAIDRYDAEYLSDDVVEVVQCDTLAALRYHFIGPNQQLYQQLQTDQEGGNAPDVEAPFPRFAVQVPCSDHEITTRQRKAQDKAQREAATKVQFWKRESDDAMLERTGVFKTMRPHQPILFAVITGGGMEERYGSLARTWCGSQLAACVYFSNETTSPSKLAAVPTLDIVQDLLDNNGYPAWSLRSEYHWPIYRSAQLRFLPALDWMRQRVMADPHKNPKTNAFFGSAQWVLLVDDDSFVFYHNLKTHLDSLDHRKPIYTGLVSPEHWLPTNLTYDGHGEENRDGFVNSYDMFVNGGSGSIFSAAALKELDTQGCVNEMRPDGKWWQFQSDWAVGACAHRAGVSPTVAERGLFNQFICVDDRNHPYYCQTFKQRSDRHATGGWLSWDRTQPNGKPSAVWETMTDDIDGPLSHPATIHPIKSAEGFDYLWKKYSKSIDTPINNVTRYMEALDVDIMALHSAASSKEQGRVAARVTTVDNFYAH